MEQNNEICCAILPVTANGYFGQAFAQSQTTAFGYNSRSEVTGAVMHTNTYGYVFDPIGNRLLSSHNAETNTYIANALNQYSQISAPPAPLRYPLYDADGNMTFDVPG
jgi:hypothetical protein